MITEKIENPNDLPQPYSVRTPGRTWTEFKLGNGTDGDGELEVNSPEAVEVLTISAAQEQYPEKMAQVFFSELDADENTVTAHHANNLAEGVFIHVPEGTAVDEPVTIKTTATDGFFPHHVLVYAEKGSAAEVVERNAGGADCDSSFTEIYVGDDATVSYTKLNALSEGNGYADNAAYVADEGTVNWLMLSVGSTLYRNSITTRLAGSRSTLQYNLGFLGADEQHMDYTAHVIHDGDNTRCNMDSRGVAMDKARTIYRGIQQVAETTSGTKSFQDEKTILIGDDCEADTTPQLQINNNEVEATHAATTGHIDEESLFYMKSRGITENEAKREIVTGMFDNLIEHGNQQGKEVIHRKIRETLGR